MCEHGVSPLSSPPPPSPQVKDLLASSLLGRGFSVVLDESVASAARTRSVKG